MVLGVFPICSWKGSLRFLEFIDIFSTGRVGFSNFGDFLRVERTQGMVKIRSFEIEMFETWFSHHFSRQNAYFTFYNRSISSSENSIFFSVLKCLQNVWKSTCPDEILILVFFRKVRSNNNPQFYIFAEPDIIQGRRGLILSQFVGKNEEGIKKLKNIQTQ